jgi:hypothetical protein
MKPLYLTGTEAECEAYRILCRKAAELPYPGVQDGPGPHVDMPPAPPGIGWTTEWAPIQKHPDRDEHAVQILEVDPVEVVTPGKLTAVEKQAMVDAQAAAVDLPGDWAPDVGP